MTSARSLAASAVALGFASALTAPMPASAAPAPCERAESYAAQSGAESMRIERLEVRMVAPERPTAKNDEPDEESGGGPVGSAADRVLTEDPNDSDTISEGLGMLGDAALGGGIGGGASPDAPREAGRTATVTDVGLGDARTALIGNARVKSAAFARILAGRIDGKAALTDPVRQQAPPNNTDGVRRSTSPGEAGPVDLGSGQIGANARWDAGMSCGNTVGEAARAESSLRTVSLLGGSLVRVPEPISGLSTTGLERSGPGVRSVASATVTAGRIELAGGKVQVRVLRPPTLAAVMSAGKGGEVRYRPAVLEVSGGGVTRQRLDAAGEHVEITLRPDRHAMESAPLSGLRELGAVGKAAPLPLPPVPGLPSVSAPRTESAPAPGSGTKLRISIGNVRQAARGNAIAARAIAIKVTLTQAAADDGRTKQGYAGRPRPAVSLALGFGLLEAAAVAPEAPARFAAVSGAGGGLPITGPRLDLLALGGAGLLAAGAAAVFISVRSRRRPRS
jgi:hypothetical protein